MARCGAALPEPDGHWLNAPPLGSVRAFFPESDVVCSGGVALVENIDRPMLGPDTGNPAMRLVSKDVRAAAGGWDCPIGEVPSEKADGSACAWHRRVKRLVSSGSMAFPSG